MRRLLLLPSVTLCALFVAWPLVEVVQLSMLRTNFVRVEWVGLDNYRALLTDPAFLRACLNSLWYIVILVPIQVGVSLVAALTVQGLSKRWHDVSRIIFYVPILSAGIIIAQVWRWVFHIDGPINWLLGTQIGWFAQGYTAIPAVGFIVGFVGIGGNMIVLLASLLSVDHSMIDAAKIDGASTRQIHWRIMVPCIMPTVMVLALLAAISAPQIFETIYALAPYEHSATVAFHIYREGFHMGRYGTAAAQAVLLGIATVLMSWVKTRLSNA